MNEATLLNEIDAFIKRTGMGESYFGFQAARNSALVKRLRAGRNVELRTAERVKKFISTYNGGREQGGGTP